MKSSLEIRTFRPEDQDASLAIFKAGLFQYAVEGSVVRYMEHQYFKLCSSSDMKDIYSYYVENDDRCFFVAECQGTVAGIVAGLLTRNDDGEAVVELQRMSVSKEFRRRGAGSMLVQRLLAWAREKRAQKVFLGTLDRKVSAIALYKKNGFQLKSSKPFEAKWFEEQFGVVTDEIVVLLTFERTVSSSTPSPNNFK